jgi:hypothetical protein
MTLSPYRSHSGAQPDTLSADEFHDELRRTARNDGAAVENALGAAVMQIEQDPALSQSRLLARVLSALTFGVGQFRRAELSAFDRPTRALALALVDARVAGTIPPEAWEKAVDAAGVAQLAAEDGK